VILTSANSIIHASSRELLLPSDTAERHQSSNFFKSAKIPICRFVLSASSRGIVRQGKRADLFAQEAINPRRQDSPNVAWRRNFPAAAETNFVRWISSSPIHSWPVALFHDWNKNTHCLNKPPHGTENKGNNSTRPLRNGAVIYMTYLYQVWITGDHSDPSLWLRETILR